MVARDINTQIYKFAFFTRGGHYVLENDGYVTDIETRYGIPYVGDTPISIFLRLMDRSSEIILKGAQA